MVRNRVNTDPESFSDEQLFTVRKNIKLFIKHVKPNANSQKNLPLESQPNSAFDIFQVGDTVNQQADPGPFAKKSKYSVESEAGVEREGETCESSTGIIRSPPIRWQNHVAKSPSRMPVIEENNEAKDLKNQNNGILASLVESSQDDNLVMRVEIDHSCSFDAQTVQLYQPRRALYSQQSFRILQADSSGHILPTSDGNLMQERQTPPSPNEKRKPTLFFFHGVGGSSSIWTAQLEWFSSQGYEVIAPDMLGHGLSPSSSRANDYMFKKIAEDFTKVFDHFRSDHNVVIGHSYGSCFAAYLATYRAEWVSHLVLISGGGPVPLEPELALFSLPAPFLSCIHPIVRRSFKKGAFYRQRERAALDRDCEKAFHIPSLVLKRVMQGQIWPEGDEDFHRGLTQPTLLIIGSEDQFDSVDAVTDMHSTISKSHMEVIPDASHMVMMEKPDEVNKAIHDLLIGHTSFLSSTSVYNSPQRYLHTAFSFDGHHTDAVLSQKTLPGQPASPRSPLRSSSAQSVASPGIRASRKSLPRFPIT